MLHLQYNEGDHPCHAGTDQHTERKRGKAYRAIRLSDQQRFSRQTEKLDQIAGQLSFFNEAEANCDENASEPGIEETIAEASKPFQKPKKKGQHKEDMESYPQEERASVLTLTPGRYRPVSAHTKLHILYCCSFLVFL